MMTLAVMTRASRGHTGRPRVADRATVLIYLFVIAAAVVRVAAPFWSSAYAPLLIASAALWATAFALFALAYGPMLLRPRLSNRQDGPKANTRLLRKEPSAQCLQLLASRALPMLGSTNLR